MSLNHAHMGYLRTVSIELPPIASMTELAGLVLPNKLPAKTKTPAFSGGI